MTFTSYGGGFQDGQKRAIEGSPSPTTGTYEAALLADGVPADKLYPLDTQRALKVYDRIKNDAVYWGDRRPADADRGGR
ncbi:MAG: hypothetical protein GEV11_14990 [Streptosporangiales bacterium]|nr:hypothetical protein [Streptosporangiales bacterium]